jgi:hypothetical protein
LVEPTPDTWKRSSELRRAVGNLDLFINHVREIERLDPSLAKFVGRGAPRYLQWPGWKGGDEVRDFELIEEIVEMAEDAAVWDGDVRAALTRLNEAIAFAERRISWVKDTTERSRYGKALERAQALRDRLINAPAEYSGQARTVAWKAVRLDALAALYATIRDHEVLVPGEGVEVDAPSGDFQVFAFLTEPDTRGLSVVKSPPDKPGKTTSIQRPSSTSNPAPTGSRFCCRVR